MRIDKFLWCVRLCKTRSQATDLVKKGKVKLNGDDIKPSREVASNHVISVFRNNAEFKFKVIGLLPNRVGPKLVENFIQDITDPNEIVKFQLYQESQKVYRNFGDGKPTKKDRRDLGEFLDWESWE